MRLWITFLCLFWTGLITAQTRPPVDGVPPALMVRDGERSKPITLEKVDTSVIIRGLLAETTMTMTFRNPQDRVLAGEILFPLPEGATISGYGLDVDGELVDGVVVEKHQARIAFEKEVRKGVDPGLVEWVRGNNFRTRVYPIPARGTRTIKVSYVSSLFAEKDKALYYLPLHFKDRIKEFHLKVAVVKSETVPVTESGLSNFPFAKWEDQFVAETTLKNQKWENDLRIALPRLSPRISVVEKDGRNGAVFVIHDQPDMPRTNAASVKSPRRIRLHWDASLSRQSANIKREMAFLKALLYRWSDVDVELVIFRDAVEKESKDNLFQIRGGDSSALVARLEKTPFDGGTDLAGLTVGKRWTWNKEKRVELHLLFSDGHGNVGLLPITASSPMITVASQSSANHLLLRHLAQESGGEHINLATTKWTEAATWAGRQRFSLLSVSYDPKELAEVYPKGAQVVEGRVHITGQLLSESAKITLRYGIGKNVVEEHTLTLQRSDATDTGLVRRFWAQQKVNELAILPEKNKDALLDLGQRYNLVTPGSSLLVLETLAQYLEHNIEPPRSREEMRGQWLKEMDARHARKKTQETSRLENVVRLWNERIKWWEADFSGWKDKLSQKNKKLKGLGSSGSGVGGSGVSELEDGAVMGHAPEPSRAPSTGARRPRPESMRVAATPPGSEEEADEEKTDKEKTGRSTDATITIAPWDPNTPYTAALKNAGGVDAAYQTYLDMREEHGDSPAYFIDCAGFFYRKDNPMLGRRILTSILDLDLDNPALLRVVGYRLEEAGDLDLAIQILADVLKLRPEEPQSYRDLALLLSQRGEKSKTADDLGRSLELLYQVVLGKWDRFNEIELIALMELNRNLTWIDRHGKLKKKVKRPNIDKRLIKNLDVDVRILMVWDADMTDVDLWVNEPTGEKAYYGHRRTTIGGNVSRDFTQGYGPEEYCLRRLIKGDYKIQANYYGTRAQTLTGPATIKAVVYTNYGRSDEKRQDLTLQVKTVKDVADIGTINLGK